MLLPSRAAPALSYPSVPATIEPPFPTLTEDQVRRFEHLGFLQVDGLTSPEEIADLRLFYDEVVRAQMGATPEEMGRQVVLHERPLLVVHPGEAEQRRLRETALFCNAVRVVARLYGVEPGEVVAGFRLFFKPARYGWSPWHQDAAYRPPPHETITVWAPLDPATRESSCISYIPGSHRGRLVLPHRLEGDHMVTDAVDAARAVECPIEPGGALLHQTCTVHSSGANRSDHPRRSIGIVCRAMSAAERSAA
jgi:hypothetical protein